MQAFHFDRCRSMVKLSISLFWPPNLQTQIVSNNPNSIKTESTHDQGGSIVVNPKQLERCVQEPDFAVESLPLLFLAVSSDEESYQNNASEALENCGVPPTTAFPILLAQLQNGDSTQVYWACTLVGRQFANSTYTSAQSHCEAIQDHLCQVFHRDLEISAKERAAWALGQTQHLKPSSRKTLETQLENAPPRLQRLIETALQSSPV
jgi:hypothetical protein